MTHRSDLPPKCHQSTPEFRFRPEPIARVPAAATVRPQPPAAGAPAVASAAASFQQPSAAAAGSRRWTRPAAAVVGAFTIAAGLAAFTLTRVPDAVAADRAAVPAVTTNLGRAGSSAAIEARLSALQVRVDALTDALLALHRAESGADHDPSTIEGDIVTSRDMSGSIPAVKVNDSHAQIGGIRITDSEVKGTIASESRIEGVTVVAVRDASSQLGGISVRRPDATATAVAAVQASLAALNTEIGQIRAGLGELRNYAGAIEKSLSEIDANVSNVEASKARIARQQGAVSR